MAALVLFATAAVTRVISPEFLPTNQSLFVRNSDHLCHYALPTIAILNTIAAQRRFLHSPCQPDVQYGMCDTTLNALLQALKHLKSFMLIHDQWIALPISMKPNSLSKILHCGQVMKGSDSRCVDGDEKCPECNKVLNSPGCCVILVETPDEPETTDEVTPR